LWNKKNLSPFKIINLKRNRKLKKFRRKKLEAGVVATTLSQQHCNTSGSSVRRAASQRRLNQKLSSSLLRPSRPGNSNLKLHQKMT